MAWKEFLKELRRRNIIRAGLGYIAVSWVVLQAASIVFPAMNVPEPAMKYLIIALIVLLPAWLVLAWIYDYTPKGIRKTGAVTQDETKTPAANKPLNAVIIAGLSLAILLLLADRIFHLTENLLEEDDALSIAVLPFENMSSEEDEYFVLGISEDILTQLGKIEVLRVLSRFTLKQYDMAGKSPNQIGRELNVAYLLAGSVRRIGNALRIGCQLISTNDESEKWAQSYDRELHDIFQIQSEIASNVALNLRAQLTPDEKSRIEKIPTLDLNAYDIYLRGREAYFEYTPESMEKAIGHFKHAVSLDEDFALAWAGLADAYTQCAAVFGIKPYSYLDTAMVLAQKSVELDEEAAETWKALGFVNQVLGNRNATQKSYLKALEKNPNHYPSIVNLANRYQDNGNLPLAIKLYKRAVGVNPLSTAAIGNLGSSYRLLGLYDQSLEQINEVLRLDPSNRYGYYYLADTYLYMADFDRLEKAMENLISIDSNNIQILFWAASITYLYDQAQAWEYAEKAIRSPSFDPRLFGELYIIRGLLLKERGEQKASDQMLNGSLEFLLNKSKSGDENANDMLLIAGIYSILGETDNCLTWLDKSVNAGHRDYRFLEMSPFFNNAREEKQYQSLTNDLKQEVENMKKEVMEL